MTRAVRIFATLSISLALYCVSAPARAEAPAAPAGPALDAAPAKRELLAPEYPPPSARLSLALTGSAVFAAWYGVGVGASLLWPDAPGSKDLRIPVAGPWLALEHTGCPSRGDCNEFTMVLRAIATVVDGVGQLGGLLVIGEAAFLPTRSTTGERRASAPKVALRPAPFVAGRDGVGLGLTGAF